MDSGSGDDLNSELDDRGKGISAQLGPLENAMHEPLEYPIKYLEGLRLFNDEEFFACHDALEDVWTETVGDDKRFFQGLIHAAVSLFHFEGGNLGGARKMHLSSIDYLKPFSGAYMGIDVEKLSAELWYCFKELREATENTGDLKLDRTRIPKLKIPTQQVTNE